MAKKGSDISALADLLQGTISPVEAMCADIQGQISASFSAERIARNLTQKQFAELLGITQSQISRWESGDYNFTISSLAKIAVALDKKVSISIFNAYQTNNAKVVSISDKRRMHSGTYKPHFDKVISIQEG